MPDDSQSVKTDSSFDKMVRSSFQLPAYLFAELDRIAADLHTSRSALIREAVVREIRRRRQETAA